MNSAAPRAAILRGLRGLAVAAAVVCSGIEAGAATPVRAACFAPSPPVRDLDLDRYYGDSEGSEIDAGKLAGHREATAPLRAYLGAVSRSADAAVVRDSAADARCALDRIAEWAAGGALAGRITGKQAEYERNWSVAGFALAYLKVRDAARPEQRATIEPWLGRLQAASAAFLDAPDRRRNNHRYWHGLATLAVAIATSDAALMARARAIHGEAARAIAADGTLEAELARRSRALHYHVFALAPLVLMAEIAATRGEDWYAPEDGAVHRLAALVLAGLRDPARFDALAGVPQERPTRPQAGWLSLYAARFPERVGQPMPEVGTSHRWLGGDTGLLVRRLGSR